MCLLVHLFDYYIEHYPHLQQASSTLASAAATLLSSIKITLSTVRLSRAASTHRRLRPACCTFLLKLKQMFS